MRAIKTKSSGLASAVEGWKQHLDNRVRRETMSPHTRVSYMRAAEALLDQVGDVPIGNVTTEHCWAVLERWKRGSWTNVGTSLAAALAHWGSEVMPPRREWKARPKVLTWDPADYARAFDALVDGIDRLRTQRRPITVGLCALFVCMSGCRVGEAVTLRWEDCGAHWLRVNGKGGERLVPRSADLTKVLNLCPKGGEYVFPTVLRSSKTPHINRQNVWRWIKNRADEAGVEAGPQTLRRWYASELHRRGVPLDHGMRMLGHRRADTHIRYYLCAAESDLQQHAEELGQSLTRGQLDLL